MGKYDHFRYRPGKDDDIFQAVEQDIKKNKGRIDFADIARAALRQYYGLIDLDNMADGVGLRRLPAAPTPQPIIREPEEQPTRPGNILGGSLKGIKLQRKAGAQDEGDELESRLSGIITED
jgi:hypothetical protein